MKKYLADLYRLTKPGSGWIQMAEMNPPQWDEDGPPHNSIYAKVRALNTC
jgi:hypothetical protein